MTPAIAFLDKHQIDYQILRYQPSSDEAVGIAAASSLALNPDQVLKTLIVELDHGKLAVAIIPVACSLRLSALCKATRSRHAVLADAEKAQRATGYVVGGISPFGQRRKLPTYLGRPALDFPKVCVSGGRRGMLVEIAVHDLRSACSAATCDITSARPA